MAGDDDSDERSKEQRGTQSSSRDVGRFASMEMVFENLGLFCYCDSNVSPAPFSLSEIFMNLSPVITFLHHSVT